jgi:hypothetical protein
MKNLEAFEDHLIFFQSRRFLYLTLKLSQKMDLINLIFWEAGESLFKILVVSQLNKEVLENFCIEFQIKPRSISRNET